MKILVLLFSILFLSASFFNTGTALADDVKSLCFSLSQNKLEGLRRIIVTQSEDFLDVQNPRGAPVTVLVRGEFPDHRPKQASNLELDLTTWASIKKPSNVESLIVSYDDSEKGPTKFSQVVLVQNGSAAVYGQCRIVSQW